MAGVVDMTVDSGNDVSEVVDITDDSEDDITEVRAGGPPLWFGGYRRGRELGRGRSGQVFVCNRKGCRQSFAVKTMDLQRLKLSADFERTQKQMRRELEILKRLPPHRHVVQLAGAFEQGSWLLLVLELVAGGDLFTVLTTRATPRLLEREAAFVLRQLACGLRFLHGQGVIHRDLKLENVLVASARRRKPLMLYSVKITDFGLSKAVGEGRSEAKSTVGTRPYTAPEVLRGEAHGFSSDLWCLGILLFVLLAGRFPFDSSARLSQPEIEARLRGPDCSPDAARDVLLHLLRLDPSQRLPLEALGSHAWLRDEWAERPPKRPCEAAEPVLMEPAAKAPALVVAAAPAPAASPPTLQAEALPVPLVESHVEAAFKELMELANEAPGGSTLDEPLPMEDSAYIGGTTLDEPLPMEEEQTAAVGDTAEAALPDDDEAMGPAGLQAAIGSGVPRGVWTPLAVESTVRLREVQPPSPLADVMQVRMVVADRFAGFILGKSGSRIQEIALAAGCRVWMTSRQGDSERHIVMIGNYRQCKVAQELAHEQLAKAQNADWQDTDVEVLLLVRAEAAGVVTGKQGFVLGQIRRQSGAEIQLLREEVEGQRPCILRGSLQSALRAEKHVFDLVRAVPVMASSEAAPWAAAAAGSSTEQPAPA